MGEVIDELKRQIVLARTEIKNLRQHLSALKFEHQSDIKLISSALSLLKCANCNSEATTVTVNTQQASTSQNNDISYKPIGFVETPFQNKRGVPRQSSVLSSAQGFLIIDTSVFNNPQHALSGLEDFSHMWIIFHFHATESSNVPAKISPPRLDGVKRGVFSTRSPHRPCPIGLSLVKIQRIEGNKITFLGVDMINGTPVLDIKPFIPQYDYPSMSCGDTMSSMTRPPTEGISDNADTSNVHQNDGSLTPRNPIGSQSNSPADRSPTDGEVPSPITSQSASALTPISPSDSPSSGNNQNTFHSRSPASRLEYERGAPDGQERFTPPQSANMINLTPDNLRVASWITNPSPRRYNVRFTDDAMGRLNELIGARAQGFKTNIESLLSEDPRSNYVRSRYPEHEYSCVLEDVSVSCVFDSNTNVCNILAVRSADDMQN